MPWLPNIRLKTVTHCNSAEKVVYCLGVWTKVEEIFYQLQTSFVLKYVCENWIKLLNEIKIFEKIFLKWRPIPAVMNSIQLKSNLEGRMHWAHPMKFWMKQHQLLNQPGLTFWIILLITRSNNQFQNQCPILWIAQWNLLVLVNIK